MSEQKRYTADEMREMAEHLIADISDTENECNEYRNAIGSFELSDCELALRQAADAEEENAKLRETINADSAISNKLFEGDTNEIAKMLNYILKGTTDGK